MIRIADHNTSRAGEQARVGRPLRYPGRPVSFRAVEKMRPGTPVIPYMAPYGTDGLDIRAAGIPTYGITGLFIKASDAFAHRLKERVPVRSFFDPLEYWRTIIAELAGRPTM
jgi:acetylornithine deacetylase/succinyl-diaminopimelate desuccinylase-like protein